MYDKVFLNEYGFYELKKKPSLSSMKKDFEDAYYQESKGNYEQQYSDCLLYTSDAADEL